MRCIEADSLGYQGAPASGVGSATEVHGVMCDGIQTHSSKSSLSKTVSAEAARAPSQPTHPCRGSRASAARAWRGRLAQAASAPWMTAVGRARRERPPPPRSGQPWPLGSSREGAVAVAMVACTESRVKIVTKMRLLSVFTRTNTIGHDWDGFWAGGNSGDNPKPAFFGKKICLSVTMAAECCRQAHRRHRAAPAFPAHAVPLAPQPRPPQAHRACR